MKHILILIFSLSLIITGFGQTAEEYFNSGNLKSAMYENHTGAISDFNKAIEIDPLVAKYYINRGVAKMRLEDNTGTIADCNKAIKIDSQDARAYRIRGMAKGNLGDHRGSILDFTEAIKIGSHPRDYYDRGMEKLRLDQTESGCLDLSKSGELGHAEAYGAIRQYCN